MITSLKERLYYIHLNTKKHFTENKKDWYKVRNALLTDIKVCLHNESKVKARRTYCLYSIMKGN